MKCRFCGHPLSSQESLDVGAGHTCLLKRQADSSQPELFEIPNKLQQNCDQLEPIATDVEVIDFDKLRGLG